MPGLRVEISQARNIAVGRAPFVYKQTEMFVPILGKGEDSIHNNFSVMALCIQTSRLKRSERSAYLPQLNESTSDCNGLNALIPAAKGAYFNTNLAAIEL